MVRLPPGPSQSFFCSYLKHFLLQLRPYGLDRLAVLGLCYTIFAFRVDLSDGGH